MALFPLTKCSRKRGLSAIGTIEVILAMSLFMAMGAYLVGALTYSVSTTKFPNIRKSALSYASEGLEIVRYVRKDSLSNIPDGTYGLSLSGAEWVLTGSPESVTTGYTRSIVITTTAPNVKLITATVTWTDGGRTGTESLYTQLTNWQDTIVGTWGAPQGPFTYNISGNYAAYHLVYKDNILFAGLRRTNNITYIRPIDVSTYPVYAEQAELQITTVGLINEMAFNDTQSTIYAVGNSQALEVTGTNVTNPLAITNYGGYNLTSTQAVNGMYVSGSRLYLARASGTRELEIVNDNGNGTYSNIGIFNYSTTLYDVVKYGNYAYASTAAAASDIAIFNVTNEAAPSLLGTLNTASESGSSQLAMAGNYLYIFTDAVGLLIYDCTVPSAPTLVGTYATGGIINAYVLDATNQLAFLATGNNAREFQVIDISNPAVPVIRYFYNSSVPFVSIAYDATGGRIFLGSSNNTTDLTVFTQ